MTRKMPAILAAAVAVAGCVTMALALGSDHPKGQPVGGTSEWPEGLKELVNIDARVDGYFVNSDDVFYFRGDAKAFTKFLEEYAKIKDTPLRLVLHPGRGMSTKPWTDSKAEPIDWSLVTQNRAWREIAETGKKPVKKGYDITVHLYLGGNIDLEKLEAPLEIKVESGGEIEKFVITHDAKRLLVKEKAEKDKAREKAAEKAK
jgi:hypothetical protein